MTFYIGQIIYYSEILMFGRHDDDKTVFKFWWDAKSSSYYRLLKGGLLIERFCL